jgi:hypothetical protein
LGVKFRSKLLWNQTVSGATLQSARLGEWFRRRTPACAHVVALGTVTG